MKTRMTVLLAGALLVALSGSASANGRINFGITIGVPGYPYVDPPPVYYYSAPQIYYAPPPLYYAPAPWAVRHPRYWDRDWDAQAGGISAEMVRRHRIWDRDWDRRHRYWDRRNW